jgi:hypothetical protein
MALQRLEDLFGSPGKGVLTALPPETAHRDPHATVSVSIPEYRECRLINR